LTLAYCWSHLRRQFYEVYVGGNAPIATEALARIRQLYDIEAEIRGSPPEVRRAVRQQRSKPIVEALKPWSRTILPGCPKGSKLAEGIAYGSQSLGRPVPLPRRRPASRSIPTPSSVRSAVLALTRKLCKAADYAQVLALLCKSSWHPSDF